MAQEKAKGNIIYELLIVILAAALIGSIVYPKNLKEHEHRNTELSRYRMDQIFKAELQYQKYNSVFNDSLEVVLSFLKNSPEYHSYVDSVIVGGLDSISRRLDEFKEIQRHIISLLPAAGDTTVIDSIDNLQTNMKSDSRQLAGYFEYVHDRMKNLPNTPVTDLTEAFLIVDSKQFTLNMDIVKNSVQNGRLENAHAGAESVLRVIDNVQSMLAAVKQKLREFKGDGLDSLYHCPTTRKPYVLVHVDTSVIKYINIYCPIDSDDIAMVDADFLNSTIGGLRLVNHGKIESGDKSWEAKQ